MTDWLARIACFALGHPPHASDAMLEDARKRSFELDLRGYEISIECYCGARRQSPFWDEDAAKTRFANAINVIVAIVAVVIIWRLR